MIPNSLDAGPDESVHAWPALLPASTGRLPMATRKRSAKAAKPAASVSKLATKQQRMLGTSAARPLPETNMPKRKKSTAQKSPNTKTSSTKAQTKKDQLLALLRRPQGATIEQAAKTLAWQPHSVRGMISGVLKKRLGLTVTSEKDDVGRIYRVASTGGGNPS
jgi:hypothetical protein